jgi:hypothetical protein
MSFLGQDARNCSCLCAASNQGDEDEGKDGKKNNQAAQAIDQSKPGFIGGGWRRSLLGKKVKKVKKVVVPVLGGTNQGQAGKFLLSIF